MYTLGIRVFCLTLYNRMQCFTCLLYITIILLNKPVNILVLNLFWTTVLIGVDVTTNHLKYSLSIRPTCITI